MRLRTALAASITLALLWAPAASAAGSPDLVISQVYGAGGNSGATFANDFVEVFNRDATARSVDGWSIQYASATGTGLFSQNGVTTLGGTVPAGGRLLVRLAGGSTGAPLPPADATGTTNMAAGSGKVILARTTAGLACNGASAPCDVAQRALIADLVGYGTANFFEGSAPAPSASATTAVARVAGGCADSDNNSADLQVAAPQPRNAASLPSPCGALPEPEGPETCGAPMTRISAVQAAGVASPLVGQQTSVEGVVVGDYQQAGDFGGFYVQDQQPDGDPMTSEGLFVRSSEPVGSGDLVRVRGTVAELASGRGGLTALINPSQVTRCTAGHSVAPTEVSLPLADRGDFEHYEGMAVRFTQPLTVTETFTLGRFGEVRLAAGGRLFTPTNVVAPGAAAAELADANARRSFVLDDGDNRQNVDPTRYPQGGLDSDRPLRSGDTVPPLEGVVDDRFGAYRVQPVGDVTFEATNPRPAAPAAVGGTLQVAAFNVLNFFNGPAFPTARGASTPFELERQTAKEVSALVGLDADVVGLMELENDEGADSAIQELVDAVNARTGEATYDYVDTGVVGTDTIRVGLLYKPTVVRPVGEPAILDSSVDARFVDTLNRPTIAQAFELRENLERVTVAVNHLKSKGSSCAAQDDPDTGDGQGNCNLTRVRAARALAEWLKTDPTDSGTTDVLVIGDLNAYAEEDPVRALREAGFVDQVRRFGGPGAYSYVFDGQAGYLDHALASSSLSPKVTGASDWHINADEPIVFDYNTEFKTANHVESLYAPGPYRSSDHDPVRAGLDLRPTFADAIALTRRFVERAGVAEGLIAKLEAARRARDRGDAAAEADALQSYRAQLAAQSGKTIDPERAALLAHISTDLTEDEQQ